MFEMSEKMEKENKYVCPHCGHNLNDPELFRDTVFYCAPPRGRNIDRIRCACGEWLRDEGGDHPVTDW